MRWFYVIDCAFWKCHRKISRKTSFNSKKHGFFADFLPFLHCFCLLATWNSKKRKTQHAFWTILNDIMESCVQIHNIKISFDCFFLSLVVIIYDDDSFCFLFLFPNNIFLRHTSTIFFSLSLVRFRTSFKYKYLNWHLPSSEMNFFFSKYFLFPQEIWILIIFTSSLRN